MSSFSVCFDVMVEFITTKPYTKGNRVFMKSQPNIGDFTYVYEYFSKELDISFPLSPFECRMLIVMNVRPSKLHPSSWAFLKAFQVLCIYLQIDLL